MAVQLSLDLSEAAPVFPFVGQPVPVESDARFSAAALEALTDVEVLGRLLPDLGSAGVAEIVMSEFDSLAAAAAASRSEFVTRTLLHHNVQDRIRLAVQIGGRVAKASLDRLTLNSFYLVQEYLQTRMGQLPQEQFRVLFLDTKNRLIEDQIMTSGTYNHCAVYPREIMRRALELHAHALVLAHNHPSGDCTPSEADIKMTREVVTVAKALSITVHDHIIVGRGQYSSFMDRKLI